MKTANYLLGVLFVLCLTGVVQGQVPQLINYQGRVAVGLTNFNGSGQFKFALVNTNGSATYWSNDGTSIAGAQPTSGVTLTVNQGLYSLLLGDTTLTNMTAVPASVFTNSDVRLRVWFNDGTHGFQLLAPDQRIAAVGYAMVASNVANGAITSAQIATGAVGSNQIANGAVGSNQLASSLTLSGTVQAQTLSASGNLALPNTTSASGGVLTLNGAPFLQAYGTNNMFIGTGAGNFTLSGNDNTAVGSSALFSDTTGNWNTANGYLALTTNTTGYLNTATGYLALTANTTGNWNTATGAQALNLNTTGSYSQVNTIHLGA